MAGRRELLDSEQQREHLTGLHERWSIVSDGIECDVELKNFPEAFGFMTHVALHCEKQDHHPEWSNVYNRVHIRLTTHDEGGLTGLDFEIARIVDLALNP